MTLGEDGLKLGLSFIFSLHYVNSWLRFSGSYNIKSYLCNSGSSEFVHGRLFPLDLNRVKFKC